MDLSLPDSHGIDTVAQADAAAPHLPIVVMTGLDDEATAVEAVREGRQDFLIKGHGDGRLLGPVDPLRRWSASRPNSN